MKCMMCGKEFISKRRFKDLFKTRDEHICDECFSKNPYKLMCSQIPLKNKHVLDVVSLFQNEEKEKKNYDGYTYEYSEIYENLCKHKKRESLILMDSFYLNEDVIKEFEEISEITDEDITILTNTFKD